MKRSSRSVLTALILFSVLLAGVSVSCLAAVKEKPPIPPSLEKFADDEAALAKAWYQHIIDLRKKTNAFAAARQSAVFLKWLNAIDNDAIRTEFKPLALEAKAESHRMAGQFVRAANTYNRAWNLDKQDKFTYGKINAEKLRLLQLERFQKVAKILNNREELAQRLLDNARKRKQLLAEFHKDNKGGKITPKEIDKLREAIKKLAESRKDLQDKMEKSQLRQWEITRQYRRQGVFLSPAQKARLQPLYANIDRMLDSTQRLQKENRKDLLGVVEKYHYTWDGMQEVFNRLPKKQEEIRDLQKKFLELAGKKPLGAKEEAGLVDLKNRIDKLSRQMDRLLGDLEEGFMKSKRFSKLTRDQKDEYLKNLKRFKDAENRIEDQNDRIAKVFKKIAPEKRFGDLNQDGTIDGKDLDAMESVMFRMPIQKGEDHYRRNYDLNGDGRITMADWGLLRQAVNGPREQFPVDPDTIRGDIDGDGKLTAEDLRRLSWHFVRHGHRKSRFVRSDFDMNDDGKFTLRDVFRLAREIREAQDVDRKRLDVNGDGRINALDLMKIMELATISKVVVDPDIRKAADLNGDGKVDELDILAWGRNHPDPDIEDPVQTDPENPEIALPPIGIQPEAPVEEPQDADKVELPGTQISEPADATPQDIPTQGTPAETGNTETPETTTGTEESSGDLLDR